MSVLSDQSIERCLRVGSICISPYDKKHLQPASYDVTLASEFRIISRQLHGFIDPYNLPKNLTEKIICYGDHISLHPGDFILGSTQEYFTLDDNVVARVEGRSSLGRIGLLIHSTAGWIDPGFRGNITLELSNQAPMPILLYPGMKIGQIAFMQLTSRAVRPYGSDGLGSRYQGDTGTVESRYDAGKSDAVGKGT